MKPRGVTIVVHIDGDPSTKKYHVPLWAFEAGKWSAVTVALLVVLFFAFAEPLTYAAARVPGLEREVARLSKENGRVQALAQALSRAEANYQELRQLLGGRAGAAPAAPMPEEDMMRAVALRASIPTAAAVPTSTPTSTPAAARTGTGTGHDTDSAAAGTDAGAGIEAGTDCGSAAAPAVPPGTGACTGRDWDVVIGTQGAGVVSITALAAGRGGVRDPRRSETRRPGGIAFRDRYCSAPGHTGARGGRRRGGEGGDRFRVWAVCALATSRAL